MGIIADRMAALRIETSSPDGQIDSVFTPIAQVSISFRGNGYRNYTERGLEHQLSALATRWWVGYREARDDVMTEVTGVRPVREEIADARSRRFRAERDSTDCEGMSPRALIHVSGTGLHTWRVVLRDGVLASLDETEFADELAAAYRAAIRDFGLKLNRMQDKYFPR